MEFQPGQTVYRGHMEDNVIVFDEPVDIPKGAEVLVQIPVPGSGPRPGTAEAVIRSRGIITIPSGFDLSKITREEIYD